MEKQMPESYKKHKFYNWNGVFYYQNKPLIEVEKPESDQSSVVDTYSDFYFVGIVFGSGYILIKDLSGNRFYKLTH
jgi:hypothetical protein